MTNLCRWCGSVRFIVRKAIWCPKCDAADPRELAARKDRKKGK